MYSIYALLDPRTNRVRYVGCTYNLKHRLSCHISSGRFEAKYSRRSRRGYHPQTLLYASKHWIADLIKARKRPEPIILDTSKGKKKVVALERFWIKEMRASGEPLVNGPQRSAYKGSKRH